MEDSAYDFGPPVQHRAQQIDERQQRVQLAICTEQQLPGFTVITTYAISRRGSFLHVTMPLELCTAATF